MFELEHLREILLTALHTTQQHRTATPLCSTTLQHLHALKHLSDIRLTALHNIMQHSSATPHCTDKLHPRLLTGAPARDPAHRTPHHTAPPHCNTTLQQHTTTPVCAGAPARDPARRTP